MESDGGMKIRKRENSKKIRKIPTLSTTSPAAVRESTDLIATFLTTVIYPRHYPWLCIILRINISELEL